MRTKVEVGDTWGGRRIVSVIGDYVWYLWEGENLFDHSPIRCKIATLKKFAGDNVIKHSDVVNAPK